MPNKMTPWLTYSWPMAIGLWGPGGYWHDNRGRHRGWLCGPRVEYHSGVHPTKMLRVRLVASSRKPRGHSYWHLRASDMGFELCGAWLMASHKAGCRYVWLEWDEYDA
mgnify:CR=1 FL=1